MARLTLVVQGGTGFNTEEGLDSFFRNEIEGRITSLLVSSSRIVSWRILPLMGPYDPSPKIEVVLEGPHMDAFISAIATVLRREIKAVRETEVA